ncbi:GAF domain-containing protein [Pararhizobium sp. YC-54]|uniref:GAF domain-containing protein n=1 Tax=Pararhizobium sp. YC-54 TaxID=2986920 RepID=UPI0021F7537F|nr:GAF domain-containing protein [Pararhizobium sp. YC-54]MCV9999743.1 GAF domain-containing protein [Pararhizobium sp. YC-54]
MPDYQKFVAAVAEAGSQPEKAFAALEVLTKELVGVKLFTIMTSDTRGKLSERIYSNMPDVYPVSGTKPYNETHWSEITLNQKKTFVANTIEDIANVFDDHALIKSLGCESVINVPIVVGGDVIGTLNCLHDKDFYTKDRIEAAEALKLPGLVCMLLHAQQKKEAK